MMKAMLFAVLIILFKTISLSGHTVLITGGAGYIGSYVNEKLYREGHDTIILDDLSTGFQESVLHGTFIRGQIGDRELLEKIFSTYKIDAVMHFAALLNVAESVLSPIAYYKVNVDGTLALLEAMRDHACDVLIFSSSAAVYGVPQQPLIREDHPCSPINPYGRSKLMVEQVLQDCDRAYGIRYSALRYFNAAGGDPEGKVKDFKKNDYHLIPVAVRCLQQAKPISVFGNTYPTEDGTCVRDYVHIDDLASAHIAAMKRLLAGGSSSSYNLGIGKGFSVREVISAVEKVLGKEMIVTQESSRIGDPPYLVACSEKAKRELNWEPKYTSLEEMIEHYLLSRSKPND